MNIDFSLHSTDVAPLLLGATLHGPNGAGRIVEVEAYGGAEDAASHAAGGPTPRSEIMFGPDGVLYVYLIYGMHHCANVVTGAVDEGQAVLIRAVEPIGDTTNMKRARPAARREVDLSNGPGKLCTALGIDLSHNRTTLSAESSAVWVEPAEPLSTSSIEVTTRIGISVAQELRWRWYLRDNEWVSKKS